MHKKLNTTSIRFILGVIFSILLPAAAYAAAWTREQGSFLIVFPTTYTAATKQFDADGNKVDRPRFQMLEIAPLAEYGLTDFWTAGVQPKFRSVKIDTTAGEKSNDGFPEANVFSRLRLWHGDDAAFSVQGLVKLPVDPEENNAVALGRDQIDAEFRMLFGNRHRIGTDTIFYDMELAYRKRFDGPSDEIYGDAFIGWSTGPVVLILQSLNTVGLNDDAEGVEVLTAKPKFRKHVAQLTAAYRISDGMTVAAGGSSTYAGTNIGAAYSGFISAIFRF